MLSTLKFIEYCFGVVNLGNNLDWVQLGEANDFMKNIYFDHRGTEKLAL